MGIHRRRDYVLGEQNMAENENRVNTDGLMRECLECGQEFIPDESGQECCDNDCAAVYYDWEYDWWEEHADDDVEYYDIYWN